MTAADRLAWARQNPAACLAPFSGLSLRAHYTDDPGIRYSCCCNLDVQHVDHRRQEMFFQDLRTSLQQGQQHAACKLCYEDEDRGAISERIRYWLDFYDQGFDRFVHQWQSDVFEVKIKFSNQCPMACRSCAPGESSTYAQIARDSVAQHIREDFTADPEHWQEVIQSVKQAAERNKYPVLHLIGGEPLVQAGCERLLAWMQQENLCSRFELRITTSWAVNLSDSLLSLMQSFRHVNFLLSIDSTGPNYHYVRWPVKFEKVERNLQTLIDIRHLLPSHDIRLVPVFSLNNAFYIKDYLDYFLDWQEKNGVSVIISNQHLYDPVHLQLEILPDLYRPYLIEHVQQCMAHPMVQSQPILQSSLASTLAQLEQPVQYGNAFISYLKHTAEFDARTRTRFADSNGRLYNLLNDHHRELYLGHLAIVDTNKPLTQSVKQNSYEITQSI